MAQKSQDKKVSINMLDKLIESVSHDDGIQKITYNLSDGTLLDIIVKTHISFNDMKEFVEIVVDSAFATDEHGDVIFSPCLKRVAYALSFISFYTNLKAEMGVDRVCALLYKTNIFDELFKMVDSSQILDLNQAIDESIQFKQKTLLSSERIRLQYLMEQMDKMMPMLEQNAGLLAGMSQEDLTKAVQAMGNMDEGKLAKAVLKEQEGKVVEMPKPKKASTRKKKADDVD